MPLKVIKAVQEKFNDIKDKFFDLENKTVDDPKRVEFL